MKRESDSNDLSLWEQRLRASQRTFLKSYLQENENAVPSTTGRILDRLRQEQIDHDLFAQAIGV